MIASERKNYRQSIWGDIIGVFDPGIFSIGDTLTTSKEKFAYEGIPTFAPEHFARVRQVDTMKRKQFVKESIKLHRKEQFRSFRNITQEWKKSLSALSAFCSLMY